MKNNQQRAIKNSKTDCTRVKESTQGNRRSNKTVSKSSVAYISRLELIICTVTAVVLYFDLLSKQLLAAT